MSSTALFLLFKGGLVLAAVAFAVREFVLAGRPDSDPELTRRLVRVFSAAERGRRRLPAPAPPPAEEAPAAPEAPRRAA